MVRICAWCGHPLGLSVVPSEKQSAIPTSHGICAGCARVLLAETEGARRSARGATAPGDEEE